MVVVGRPAPTEDGERMALFIGTKRAIVTLVLASGLATGVCAQIATQSKSPIDVTADQAEVVQSKCMAIWRGSAEALQDTSRLRANTITVYSKVKSAHAGDGQSACGGTDKIVADGDVYYVTPERNARGDHAVYTPSDDQIVMTGAVIVVQGQDVARGDKLIIDVASHQARMVSDVTGAGKSGRVRGVYFPDKSAQPPSPAPPPPVTPPAAKP
jgi:lipopolysaccharide export system protein LptA